MRDHTIFTIDPPTAKDLDDALHVKELPDGTFELGVHIADVSFFVEEGTALDTEAKRRATSVYLVQKVIPMLPSILCEQLCSLNPNVDRLAFSCIWKMNADGTLVDETPWFGRTVIRSCAKLDYPTAQRVIDGIIPTDYSAATPDEDAFRAALSEEVWETGRRPVGHTARDVAKAVLIMNRLARERRARRLAGGALVLDNPKLTVSLDVNGNPIGFGTYTIRESNMLVEEYMLLANYFVAEKLISDSGNFAFLRSHPSPDMKGLSDVKSIADVLGIPLDITTANTLQLSLNRVGKKHSKIITALLMQPMKPAVYIVAGSSEPEKWRHYALAIPYYTHFTSPIRRYADLVVHRQLARGIAGAEIDDSEIEFKSLFDSANNCNEMKMASMAAQERSSRMFWAVYLKTNPMEVEGIVIKLGEKSFTIYIEGFSYQSRFFIDSMKGVDSSFEEETKTIYLTNHETLGASNRRFQQIRIGLMTRLRLHLTATNSAPIDINIDVVDSILEEAS